MTTITSETNARQSNPLALPLLIVSVVAVVELAGLIAMTVALARRPEPVMAAPAGQQGAAVAAAQTPPAPPATPVADQATPGSTSGPKGGGEKGFVVGKKGERVESAGFAITVEDIKREPYYKNLGDPGPDQKYLALLVAIENNTGGNAMLFDSMFHLQDDRGYTYDKLGLALTSPKLEWRMLGNRDRVRGYLDFIVPKDAKGLKLVYSHLPRSDSLPIHVELGE